MVSSPPAIERANASSACGADAIAKNDSRRNLVSGFGSRRPRQVRVLWLRYQLAQKSRAYTETFDEVRNDRF